MRLPKLWMSAVILTVCGFNSLHAQVIEGAEPYFTSEEMPDMMVFLPAPPDSTSVAFMNDVARYYWGKEMRNDPERAAEAIRDAVFSIETIVTEYEAAFGMRISEEETPAIFKVLRDGAATCRNIASVAKKTYNRRRPFMVFDETTLVPEDEEHLRTNGSFPSGHTILGWSSALLLTEINPGRATELLTRGYRYGENRLVVGAHWQSDTDAARLAASAAYARLHTSELFLEDMRKAREEYLRLTGGTTQVENPTEDVPSAVAAPSAAATGEYTLSGMPATSNTKGIIVSDGQKVLRK